MDETLTERLKRLRAEADVDRAISYLENGLPLVQMTEEERRLGAALHGPDALLIGNWSITERKP